MIWPILGKYEGAWEGDELNGQGVFISANGRRYEGLF